MFVWAKDVSFFLFYFKKTENLGELTCQLSFKIEKRSVSLIFCFKAECLSLGLILLAIHHFFCLIVIYI